MKVIHYSDLKNIGLDLMKDKGDEITTMVSHLSYEEINSEEKLLKAKEILLARMLLKKIVLGEPRIMDHEETIQEVPPSAHNPFGGKKRVIRVNVHISIEGSLELLYYSPNGYSFTDSTFPEIILPTNDQYLDLTVEVSQYDKQIVLAEVERVMTLSKQFIHTNNSQVDHFNSLIMSRIAYELTRHHDNLNKLYA